MAYKQFTPDVLSSSEVQSYLMNQSVIVFANATARTAALTAPTEGMVTYLEDIDELEVYNGSAWRRILVTPEDDALTLNGDVTIAKANPKLRLEESTGTDNVDIELSQVGMTTEGLRIRYESGTGNSRISNIYNGGNLYLQTSNIDTRGVYIDSNGYLRLSQDSSVYGLAGEYIGTSTLVDMKSVPVQTGLSSLNNWVNVCATLYAAPAFIGHDYVYCVWGFSCYVNSGGSVQSRVLSQPDTGGSYATFTFNHFTNESYSHKWFTAMGRVYVNKNAAYSALYCQFYGNGITAMTDSNDSAWMMVFSP